MCNELGQRVPHMGTWGTEPMTRAEQLTQLKARFGIANDPMPEYFQMPSVVRHIPSQTTYGSFDVNHLNISMKATDAQLERRIRRD